MEGEEKDFIVRRMRITREFIRKAGFTNGCPGCRAVNRGQPAVNHNEECSSRIEGMLREAGNEKVLRADERIKERNEERDNKRRRLAGGNQDNSARRGVQAEDDNPAAAAAGNHGGRDEVIMDEQQQQQQQ